MTRLGRPWPLVLLASSLALAVALAADLPGPLRGVLALWFLLICPGMAVVGLLNVKDLLAEVVLGIALSIAIGMLLAVLMLVSHTWSPNAAFAILAIATLVGAAAQYVENGDRVVTAPFVEPSRPAIAEPVEPSHPAVAELREPSHPAVAELPDLPPLADRTGLTITNPLVDLETVAARLDQAAAHGWLIDAFLLAAGANQVVEDYLHDASLPIDGAVSLLAQARSPGARAARGVLYATGRAIRWFESQAPATRRALAWQRRAAAVVDALAQVGIDERGAPSALLDRCRRLAEDVSVLPQAARSAVLRLPACFHGFDQRPEDLQLLARRFEARWPDRRRPLLVVGVRTSGSYLAPLIAAALRGLGFGRVDTMTIRPRRPLLGAERARVRALSRAGGMVLLTDDPPVTGASLAASAAQLRRLGVQHDSLVCVAALQGDVTELLPALAGLPTVLLSSREWAVHGRLKPERVRPVVAALLRDEVELTALAELPFPGRPGRRGHRRALFEVRGVDRRTGAPRRIEVLASAVGWGYLGSYQLAVAEAMSEHTSRVLGLRDDVLYCEWVPPGRRLESQALPVAVASYAAARRQTLTAPSDFSTRMVGERPVWEVVSIILARGFGRTAPAARLTLVDRAARRLLEVHSPSLVDGNMSAEHWFTAEHGRGALKVGLSDRTYWSLGLASFDARFDVAGVGALAADHDLSALVRKEWCRQTGEGIDAERWLLYELAHLWGTLRESPAREGEVRHAGARAAASYFAEVFLADLKRTEGGPLCALDLDGVLERDQLGFSAPTRASAEALRALITHGYDPVLVTGRGASEVGDRCRAYGLAGGVAEYGAAICVDRGERTIGLLGTEQAAALNALRAALRARDEIHLDPAFAYAVRAYRLDGQGRRVPLGVGETAALIEVAGRERVGVITGQSQTDFVPAGIDKGTGLTVLLETLRGAESRVDAAIGDTAADLPMLALARRAFVPAHARALADHTPLVAVNRPFQAGLACAVGELIGHPPGTCPRCRVPHLSSRRELLLELLSIGENGPTGLATGALRLAWRMR